MSLDSVSRFLAADPNTTIFEIGHFCFQISPMEIDYLFYLFYLFKGINPVHTRY